MEASMTDEDGDAVDRETQRRNNRLASWFNQWRTPIRRWLVSRSSVPTADVDDLAQEVFLRLLRYSDDVIVENPQSYLFRIATNVANEWRERARVRRPHGESWLEDLQIAPGDEPENTLARTLVHRNVHAAVDRLPPRQREVLLLHVNEGLTYVQIAKQKQLTYRVVLRDLTRAYSQLRQELDLADLGAFDPP
jgi:RNA polymerase sigma-70 factor (ECF subfamily)